MWVLQPLCAAGTKISCWTPPPDLAFCADLKRCMHISQGLAFLLPETVWVPGQQGCSHSGFSGCTSSGFHPMGWGRAGAGCCLTPCLLTWAGMAPKPIQHEYTSGHGKHPCPVHNHSSSEPGCIPASPRPHRPSAPRAGPLCTALYGYIRILPLNSDFPTQALSSSAQPHL